MVQSSLCILITILYGVNPITTDLVIDYHRHIWNDVFFHLGEHDLASNLYDNSVTLFFDYRKQI